MSAAQAEGAAGADGAACARGHGRPPPRPHGEGPERQLSGAMGPSPAPRHEPPSRLLPPARQPRPSQGHPSSPSPSLPRRGKLVGRPSCLPPSSIRPP